MAAVTRKASGRAALPRYSYRRYGYQLVDYPKQVRLLGDSAFRELPLNERRKLLRRSLSGDPCSDEFACACRDPQLRNEAVSGALARLEAGNVGWAFVIGANWSVALSRARAAVLSAARRCKPRELAGLARALGQVGGPTARRIAERIFEQVVTRAPRSDEDWEQLYEAAGALMRVSPRRSDAARILIDGLDSSHWLRPSAAARAVRDVGTFGRGAGATLLRRRLRSALKVPDPDTFFVVEHLLWALSRRSFLKGCETLLGHRAHWTREIAADRLVRSGGPRERARVLAWASGKAFGVQLAVVSAFGNEAPPALLRRTIRRGLQRRSAFERHRTVWLLKGSGLPELASIARQALEREPDPELRAELRALLANQPGSRRR